MQAVPRFFWKLEADSLVVEAIALDPQGLRFTVQKMFRGCTKQHLCYVTPIQQGIASV